MKKIVKEYKDKSAKELGVEEKKLRDELNKSIMETKVKQEKDTNLVSKKRKRLAIVLTIKSIKEEVDKLKINQSEPAPKKEKPVQK